MQSPTLGDGNTRQTWGGCAFPSPTVLLIITVLATITATSMLCTAIMSSDWEQLEWNYTKLVDVLALFPSPSPPLSTHFHRTVLRMELPDSNDILPRRKNNSIFLVPMLGGLWNLCIQLKESEMRHLGPFRHAKLKKCIGYLDYEDERRKLAILSGSTDLHLGPHLRMQNLAMSCAVVCLILLGTASLLGIWGLCKKQNSAILITGVMYLLAALFALFASLIMIFKRKGGGTGMDYDGVIAARESVIQPVLFQARKVSLSWSVDLALCGVTLCTVASMLWLLLAKILRYASSAFPI